jgi:DNA polymerase III epsilon subunit family exonuclease
VHDDADAAGGGVTTLAERALAYLREGPRPSLDVVRDVMGLQRANLAVAERLAVALLGADPRFSFDLDGRWTVIPAPAWQGVPLGEIRWAVVDVETTGMRARHGDRVTEIAVVHVDGPRVSTAFESLVNPGRPIPWRIAALTGITDTMVEAAPGFDAIADRLEAALAGRVFVAHNARFDWAFVSAELERSTGYPPQLSRICTVRLTRRLVPELERRGLDSVMHYFGLETDRRHRAGGDAEVTARALLRLLQRAGDRGVATFEALALLGRV